MPKKYRIAAIVLKKYKACFSHLCTLYLAHIVIKNQCYLLLSTVSMQAQRCRFGYWIKKFKTVSDFYDVFIFRQSFSQHNIKHIAKMYLLFQDPLYLGFDVGSELASVCPKWQVSFAFHSKVCSAGAFCLIFADQAQTSYPFIWQFPINYYFSKINTEEQAYHIRRKSSLTLRQRKLSCK